MTSTGSEVDQQIITAHEAAAEGAGPPASSAGPSDIYPAGSSVAAPNVSPDPGTPSLTPPAGTRVADFAQLDNGGAGVKLSEPPGGFVYVDDDEGDSQSSETSDETAVNSAGKTAVSAYYNRGPQWGIFNKDGTATVVGDSIFGMEFRKEYSIPDFPLEEGAFQSYNKVESPYDCKITYTCGGTLARRVAFLNQVRDAVSSLDTYYVVMPEFRFLNANPIHMDFRRTAREGAYLLAIDIWLQEVRYEATATFTNTRSPSGSDPQDGGTVQAKPPTSRQQAAITSQQGANKPATAASPPPSDEGSGEVTVTNSATGITTVNGVAQSPITSTLSQGMTYNAGTSTGIISDGQGTRYMEDGVGVG